MKIGIVTIFDSIVNYGAFLQAYALKLCLEDMGHTVFHIVKEPDERFLARYNRAYENAKKASRTSPLRKPMEYAKIIYRRMENRVRFNAFNKDFSLLNQISEREASEIGLDLIICGSDEIWNLENNIVGDPFYFAAGVKTVKKAAYAVSTGGCSAEAFKNAGYTLTELNRFDKILARDTASQNIIHAITGLYPGKVCDPTILVDHDRLQKKDYKINKPYLFAYSYGVDKLTQEHLKRFAKDENLLLVSAGMTNKFADKNIIASPLAFGNIVKNAEYVFTSTLHGSIFTFLNKKRCALCAPYPKVCEIISDFGQKARIIPQGAEYETFRNIMRQAVTAENIDNAVYDMRMNGQKELKMLLGGVK